MSTATSIAIAPDGGEDRQRCRLGMGARLLVVGGGMAGFGLCDRLVRSGVAEQFRVSLVGDEPTPAYDRVNLTQFFRGRTFDDLCLATPQWYQQHDVELHTGRRIAHIDRAAGEAIDAQGRKHSFDQLVLATGSRAWVPPIPGANSEGVFVYRTFADLQAIDQYIGERGARVGAVIGGGLLGLEAAQVLHDRGLETSVIERAPGLMPRQLDSKAAALLRTNVERLGVQVHLVRRTEAIQKLPGGGLRIEFANAGDMDVDILIIAAGVRPNDDLARQCGLEIGPRGGVVINERLETSDPRICAIGECASFRGHVYGLVAPCYRMADVLANRLGGGSDRFLGADESAELKLLGVQVAVLGRAIGDLPAGVTLTQEDDEAYRKLLLEQGRVVGAACVGPWEELPQIRQAIHRQTRLWPMQRTRFRRTGSPWSPGGALPISQWPDDSIVCACLGVTKGTLGRLVGLGMTDPVQLSAQTGASTACGSCHSLVCELAGAQTQRAPVPGAATMLIASLTAALLTLVWLTAAPISFAESVQNSWRRIDVLWRNDIARQITGFTLLGLTLLALIFSLRKRISWFRFGDYGWWRALHGVIGALVLIAMAVHTGLRLGANLNFVLGAVFLGVAGVGAAAGILSGLEHRTYGAKAMAIRRWRPRLTRLHTWLFWPLPALIAFHILSFYWFGD